MTFMGGTYVVRFATEGERDDFVARFGACPLWPCVAPLRGSSEALILAREVREQEHGSFEEGSNTLEKNPGLLGATEVRFRRDDGLLDLLGGRDAGFGACDRNPCGSDCATCPTYGKPCRGCVANSRYFPAIRDRN